MDVLSKIHAQSTGALSVNDFAYALTDCSSMILKIRPVFSPDVSFGAPPKLRPPKEIDIDFSNAAFISPLIDLNVAGYNIFFVPNKTKTLKMGCYAKDSDVIEIKALFVDHDAEQASPSHLIGAEVSEHFAITGANIVVSSSAGKYQAYFLVKDAPPPVFFPTLQALLRNKYRSFVTLDPKVCNAARLMRMPGFCNMKYPDAPLSFVSYKSHDYLRRYSFKSIDDLKVLFGCSGRNDLATTLSGYPDGWALWCWINEHLDTPLGVIEQSVLLKTFHKHAKSRDKQVKVEGLSYIVESNAFYDKNRKKLLNEGQVLYTYGAGVLTSMKDVLNQARDVKERIVFRPDNKYDPRYEINTYYDSRVALGDLGGGASWFEVLLDSMFSVADKRIVEQFMSIVVCYPEKRLEWGLLVKGRREATGKTTLYEIMRAIINNDSFVINADAGSLKSEYNGFLENKLLVYFGEMMLEGRGDVYNKMKEMFTAKKINIRRMHMDHYSIDNYAKFYFTSNHDRPISLHGDARRLAVVSTKLDARPPFAQAEFSKFMNSEESLGCVRAYLEQVDLSDVNYTCAPRTVAKDRLIAASIPSWEADLADFMDDCKSNAYCFPKVLADRLFAKSGNLAPKTVTIGNLLEEQYGFVNLCSAEDEWPRIAFKESKYPVFLVPNHAEYRTYSNENFEEAKRLLRLKVSYNFK